MSSQMGGFMKRFASFAAISIVLAAAAPVAVGAATTAAPIVSQTVAVEGGRALQVVVAQSEIKTDINPSNLAAATGGGLLGGIIGAAVDSSRAKKAEELVSPIRAAIGDFDADGLAIATAKASFGEMAWFKANPDVPFGKDSSVGGKSALLDATSAKQIAFVEYSYDMAPNFDSVRVVAKIDVANKAVPASAQGKGEKRLSPKNLAYSTRVTCVVILRGTGIDKKVNAPLWAANNGAATRKALQLAFSYLPALTQRTLALTADDLKSLNDKKNKRSYAGGFTGRPVVSPDNMSTLLWEGSFINVVTMD